MLPDEITKARQSAQGASAAYGQAAAGEPTISDVLKQKITEAYQSSQDIIKPLDVATKDYLGAPQAGREQYQNIFNPFQRENLVSQYVGNKSLPMLSLSSILGQRFGRVEDTIGAGTRAYQADVAAKQAAAQTAQQLYESLLNEYTTSEQLRGNQEDRTLAREKFEWDKKDGGGGGGLADLLPLLLANQLNVPTEEQSQYQEPPMSTMEVGLEKEWPVGSGVIWVSDGKGGWN